ncbi:MAG: ATPase, T2SS/T4P/T4SS family [Candidatus Saccharibacteria bacterium]|nr:ATPase, T2SS/T4P/T4SS family [Candidatus Saccharibacteria bacterium]MCY4010498.1 ATPase, T2SS/T4P/T4SS family [Candidatus Saccharibacteria bacterium]MCY4088877.1 ATPase, T2SS/T4P/T4SS family [Candidatus Saccharibacteria bacterium]
MPQDGRDIEELNTLKRSEILGFSYLDIRTLTQKPLYPDLIPDSIMREYQVIPIISTDDRLTIGITTMTPPNILEDLRRIHNKQRIRYVLISNAALQDYFNLYHPPIKVIYHDIVLSTDFHDEAAKKVGRAFQDVRAEDMLAYLVHQAYRLEASDIHCEVQESSIRIRMRVNGVLYPVVELEDKYYRILVGAIASAADISTVAQDSQTGQIKQTQTMTDGLKVDINMRVETVPSIHGMDIVMRFFAFNPSQLHLAKLGMNQKQVEIVNDIIQYPRGLVLVVGPTGSGKTTTLYSLLGELNSDQTKIITLEDPVEYQMSGLTQIPIDVHKGASFAQGLRAVLRLDPDIVMVGEIRDHDTISTALRASLTGHLVMSTYHANSATLAIITILRMITEDPLMLNAIRLIQSQRLVRRLDDSTKEAYRPNEMEREQIKQIVNSMHPALRPNLKTDFKLYKPVPSEKNPFGYSGRFAIRELLVLDDQIRNKLLNEQTTLEANKFEAYLCHSKQFVTMLQEGILKVLAGQTTLAELYRTGS